MKVYSSLMSLREYIENEEYLGYDPYDALNSPYLRVLCLNNKFIKIAFIQSLKRLPINLRPFLRINKGFNPKAIGLLLWGYAKLFKFEKKEEYLNKIELLLGKLFDLKSEGYSGNCWGYNFDWQSRSFYVPKYTPTIVNSSFIGHALLDTYLYTGQSSALRMAIPIKDFILNDLNRIEKGSDVCFSYTPLDKSFVHNANLLGASLLIRLYKYTNDNSIRDAALASLAYSMKYQRDDGSWYYAETNIQRWIDSFHTGFNLQSILYFLKEGFAKEYKETFEKGVNFYKSTFFLEDGTPKYYHDRVYPLDIHSAAQAVVFFSMAGKSYRSLAEKVANWMISSLQDKKGFFYFRKYRFSANKISYIRWSQAWAFHALSEYHLNKNLV